MVQQIYDYLLLIRNESIPIPSDMLIFAAGNKYQSIHDENEYH